MDPALYFTAKSASSSQIAGVPIRAVDSPEKTGPERPLPPQPVPLPVLGPSRKIRETRGKIRPQPDRETAHQRGKWRRVWDSNPRNSFPFGAFQEHCLKPLGQPATFIS
jgi:hypothetical protein